ncbi:MAG TPA: MFS transporter, partial [Opitutus sp.]|nr:MFS transporter [Opitutus sp.]
GTIGAIAAPPLISWMALQWSWRAAFLIPAVAGVALAIGWWCYYRDPLAPPDDVAPRPTLPRRQLWRRRELWGIVLARLISDPVWYFCLFWMPGYFQEQHGLSLKTAGAIGWIPFLAGNIGALGSAACSDWLVRRKGDPVRARTTVLIVLSCFAPLACVVPFAPTLAVTVALLSIVALVCIGWFAVLGPLAADLFPAGNAGSVWSIAGAFGAVGAMVSNYAIGRISTALGSERMFLVLGCLHFAGLAVLLFSLRRRLPRGA